MKWVYLLLILVLASSVSGIGVSPSRLYAENLLRGTHWEAPVIISGINKWDEITVTIEGEISDWITVDPQKEFVFLQDSSSIDLLFLINVPVDAQNGPYEGKV